MVVAIIAAATAVIESLIREGRNEEARRYIDDMPIPEIDRMTYKAVLQKDPPKLIALMQKDTELAKIQEDPRLRDAQMESLSQLQQRGQEGYTAQEKAQMESQMGDALTRQRGANMAQDSEMARRGIGGSGIDLARQMARQQGGIQAANQTGLNIAAQGQNRALQSYMAAGNLGGQIRSQDWGQKSQVANAQDAINKFNTANQMSGQQFNIRNAMTADATNSGRLTDQNKNDASAYERKLQAERDKNMTSAKTYMG